MTNYISCFLFTSQLYIYAVFLWIFGSFIHIYCINTQLCHKVAYEKYFFMIKSRKLLPKLNIKRFLDIGPCVRDRILPSAG